jgi:hypothetical protein
MNSYIYFVLYRLHNRRVVAQAVRGRLLIAKALLFHADDVEFMADKVTHGQIFRQCFGKANTSQATCGYCS